MRPRTVATWSTGAGALVVLLLLDFGYDGAHMDRMYIVTAIIGTLVALIAACGLASRGRPRKVRLTIFLLAVPLVMLILLLMVMPISVG